MKDASALFEFMLARIAEDDEFGAHDRHLALRWGAECEAKRQLVEDGIHLEGDFPMLHSHAVWVTRVLASVYADHPDYLEEWRP